MTKQTKTTIGVSAFMLSLLMLAPFSAFASNGQEKARHSVSIRPQVDVSQSVNVSPKGEVTVRGTVTTVGTSNLVLKSWGGDWTVTVGATTKLNSRANGSIALADIKVGDVVMVHGSMKAGAGLSVEARQIKDQFIPDRAVAARGTIASIGANTLTVKSNETTWTVNTTASTKFTSKFEVSTTLAVMKVGDEVMVKGVMATGATNTINASEVKDMSLPLNAVARTGTIGSVLNNAFTLLGKGDKQNVKVTTDTTTAITVNGKAGTLADVKNDAKATVQGILNTDTGILSAVKVMVNEVKTKIEIEKKDDNRGRRN